MKKERKRKKKKREMNGVRLQMQFINLTARVRLMVEELEKLGNDIIELAEQERR